MLFDLNNDGKFDINDALILAEDPDLVAPVGRMIGYGILESKTEADDFSVKVAHELLTHARQAIASDEVTARAYINDGLVVARAVVAKLDDSEGKKIAEAALEGLQAFVSALSWEDGVDATEVILSFTQLSGPILEHFLAPPAPVAKKAPAKKKTTKKKK